MSTHNICFYKLVEVFQMSTHNICFYKENQKTYCISIIESGNQKENQNTYHISIIESESPLLLIPLKCALIRKIFYYILFSNFENI